MLPRVSGPAAAERSGFLAVLMALGVGAGVLAAPFQQTFRGGVDLIVVDVQVVDDTGNPIARIDSRSFHVTIEGKTRQVVSSNFVSAGSSSNLAIFSLTNVSAFSIPVPKLAA